jgi:hypothetical protein
MTELTVDIFCWVARVDTDIWDCFTIRASLQLDRNGLVGEKRSLVVNAYRTNIVVSIAHVDITYTDAETQKGMRWNLLLDHRDAMDVSFFNTVLTTAVGDAICRIQTVPVGSRLKRVAPAALRYHGKMPAMSITDALAINLTSISAFRLS